MMNCFVIERVIVWLEEIRCVVLMLECIVECVVLCFRDVGVIR